MKKSKRYNQTKKCEGMAPGFTLIELLVAMVVAAVALGAIFSINKTVSDSYRVQREIAHMQQNLRAAMFLIKNDLRNAGRGGVLQGRVGIVTDNSLAQITWNPVGVFNPDADDPRGYPGITMTSYVDLSGIGQVDTTSPRQVISYRVWDSDGDGRRELRRQEFTEGVAGPSPWVLVFDGIEDISFAFAVDADNDMDLDRTPVAGGPGPVMWLIDTDNDKGLDTNADNIPDGDIDLNDDGDGDGWIDSVDGGLGTEVSINRIRSVRIWLLARSRQSYTDYVDNSTYVLGHKVIDMSDDVTNANRRTFRHKMLQGAVSLMNAQVTP